MLVQIRERRSGEKGASLFVTVAALVWIVIPMLGLFVDLGILYSVKARLQAAVDGAALAAARALNLGQTTSAQATSAAQNAVNWFYANFPNGNWATYSTQMDNTSAHVTVVDSPSNANLRLVTVTASTVVPTWFMKYLGFNFTNLTATGQASRKDVVAMLVLDRSGSMCSVNGATANPPCKETDTNTPCSAMIIAAKNFTGAFAQGRDKIGLLTFSDGYYLESAPTTNFQSVLGYTNASGSATGTIDNIDCNGGTGTAAAMSMAYNQLYQVAEPGAMNFIMLETDGLPNTLMYNFYSTPGTTSTWALNTSSSCQDANSGGKNWSQGGWRTTSVPSWTTGVSLNSPSSGYQADVPAGAIGAFYAADPSQGPPYYNIVLFDPRQTTDSTGNNSIAVGSVSGSYAPGCQFNGNTTSNYNDFNWLPSQDVFGNQIAPSNEYQALSLTNVNGCGTCLNLTGTISTDWPNEHAAALNATDNAAYNVRSNATLPVYVFAIGLGGNNGNPPDPILLQRMANDPNADQFNNPPVFPACSTESSCITYANQPQGIFIYSPTSAQLGQAFLSISSQILRLSH
jgi:Flp pilus assembly protein TadG